MDDNSSSNEERTNNSSFDSMGYFSPSFSNAEDVKNIQEARAKGASEQNSNRRGVVEDDELSEKESELEKKDGLEEKEKKEESTKEELADKADEADEAVKEDNNIKEKIFKKAIKKKSIGSTLLKIKIVLIGLGVIAACSLVIVIVIAICAFFSSVFDASGKESEEITVEEYDYDTDREVNELIDEIKGPEEEKQEESEDNNTENGNSENSDDNVLEKPNENITNTPDNSGTK